MSIGWRGRFWGVQPNIDDDVLAVEVVDEGWPDQLALIPLEEVGEGGHRFLLAVGAELLVLGNGVSAFHSLARSCHWQLFLFALVERVQRRTAMPATHTFENWSALTRLEKPFLPTGGLVATTARLPKGTDGTAAGGGVSALLRAYEVDELVAMKAICVTKKPN